MKKISFLMVLVMVFTLLPVLPAAAAQRVEVNLINSNFDSFTGIPTTGTAASEYWQVYSTSTVSVTPSPNNNDGTTKSGKSVKLTTTNANLLNQFNSTPQDPTGEWVLEYNIMKTDTTTQAKTFQFRGGGGKEVSFMSFDNDGKVRASGQEVGSYTENKWYNVRLDLNFDTTNQNATYDVTVTDGSNTMTKTGVQVSYPYSNIDQLRSFSAGTIYVDDIRLAKVNYLSDGLSVLSTEYKDEVGNTITDKQNVPINLKTVKVTFTSALDETTINNNILFMDSHNTAVTYTGELSTDKKAYTMTLGSDLSRGETYTLKIATGLKNTDGSGLAAEYSESITAIPPLPSHEGNRVEMNVVNSNFDNFTGIPTTAAAASEYWLTFNSGSVSVENSPNRNDGTAKSGKSVKQVNGNNTLNAFNGINEDARGEWVLEYSFYVPDTYVSAKTFHLRDGTNTERGIIELGTDGTISASGKMVGSYSVNKWYNVSLALRFADVQGVPAGQVQYDVTVTDGTNQMRAYNVTANFPNDKIAQLRSFAGGNIYIDDVRFAEVYYLPDTPTVDKVEFINQDDTVAENPNTLSSDIKAVKLYFSSPMKETTFTGNITVKDSMNNAVAWTGAYNTQNNCYTITLGDTLDFGASYVLTIGTGVTDAFERAMAAEKTVNFRTIAEDIKIANLDFTDVSGSQVTALNADSFVKGVLTVQNLMTKDQNVAIIVGLYDANDKLQNLSYAEKVISAGALSEELSAGFNLPKNVSGYKVRAFVWDGMDTMRALTNIRVLP